MPTLVTIPIKYLGIQDDLGDENEVRCRILLVAETENGMFRFPIVSSETYTVEKFEVLKARLEEFCGEL